MARQLLLLDLNGDLFAAWHHGIREVTPVRSVSRLAAGSDGNLVAAVLDGKMLILCNVAVCLGMTEAARIREGYALLALPGEQLAGYFVAGNVRTIDADDEQVLRLPPPARNAVITSCALLGDGVVPIVDLAALPGEAGDVRHEQPVPGSPATGEPRVIRVAVTGGVPVAVGGDRVDVPAETATIAPRSLPLAPAGVGLVARVENRLVVFPAAFSGRDHQTGSHLVVADTGGETYGIWAETVGQALETATCHVEPLPVLLARPGMTACVVANDAAVPMLDLRALVADASTERDAPTISFSLESDFSHRFLRQDVEVVEIEAGSSLYALPGDEVTDVLDLPSVILVPGRGRDGRRPCGVAVYQGQPILVLGLAGTNTLYGQTGVVVRNGTFACIVAGARIRDRRTIPMGSQRALPMPPPSGTVYGCYVEGDGVVLILNVAAIAISGGDERLGGSRTETQVWRQDMVIPWATWVPEARAGREIARADAGPVVPEERVGEERVSDRNTEVADVPSDSPVAQDAVALADPGRTETPPVEVAAGESEDPGLAVIEDNALAVESPKEEAPYVPAAADKPVPSSRSRRRRPGAWLAPAAILSAVVIGGLILLRPPARSQTTPAIAGVPASQAAEARGAKASQTEAGVPTGAEGLTPVMSPPGPEVTAVLPVTVVYFAADSAVIELSAATLLDDLAAAMARMPGRPVPVLITGHTALAETPELRRALSLQRAQAVRDYLVGRMPEGSILARCVGVGAEEPASTNDTPQNMSLNRRAVIQVPGEP